jgi:hypothetical protein
MAGEESILLIREDDTLTELTSENYESEAALQAYLESYPALIPGAQMSDGEPLRWLLIRREHGVPGASGGADRWAVDHLFLDQSGIPTLVEVKRASDTRSRREVVAQMLDYAANGVVYWPAERLREQFISTCAARGDTPSEVMADHLDEGDDEESFWERVKTNLKEGRVRLLFVADRIPVELVRIIEFMNDQMSPAIVLGLEIKQFAAQDAKTLVPRVVGQTAATRTRKSDTAQHSLSLEEWWGRFALFHDEETVNVTKEICNKLNEIGDIFHPTRTNASLALGIARPEGGYTYFVFIDHKTAHFWISLVYLSYREPFVYQERRENIVQLLGELAGAKIGKKAVNGWPSIPVTKLRGENQSRFLAIVRDIAQSLRGTDL